MAIRAILVGLLSAALALAGVVSAPSAGASPRELRVEGAVATPASYTRSQLAALPQTTLADTRSDLGFSVSGVSLADLVSASAPVLPSGKNTQLRVVLTVSGRVGRLVIALGELDPDFGNHPALLALRANGHRLPGRPVLLFPTDHGFARVVVDVVDIHVALVAPPTPSHVPAGAIQITDGRHTALLTAARIAALPVVSTTVTFLAGTGRQTHTETGPTLNSVLAAAGEPITPTTSVAAIGADGYLATVTPAEATSGRRPLILSTVEDGVALTQPRLLAVGDVKGGRYVSGIVGLSVESVPCAGGPRRRLAAVTDLAPANGSPTVRHLGVGPRRPGALTAP